MSRTLPPRSEIRIVRPAYGSDAQTELELVVWERLILPVLRKKSRFWVTWWEIQAARCARTIIGIPYHQETAWTLLWPARWVLAWFLERPICRNNGFGLVLWVGDQGSGKSAAGLISTSRAAPGELAANMPVHDPAFLRLWKTSEIWKLRHACVFLDELAEWANCVEWSSFPTELRNWLIELRHKHCTVHATAQCLDQADISIRRVALFVRFPRLVTVPFLGLIFPDSIRKTKRCTWGTRMSRGNLPWIRWGTVIIYHELKPASVQRYVALRAAGDENAERALKIRRTGWLIWRQSVVDLYDSHFEMAQDLIVRDAGHEKLTDTKHGKEKKQRKKIVLRELQKTEKMQPVANLVRR